MYVQYIVVNRGLKMSRGKLMSQAAHAAMAFLTRPIRQACADIDPYQGFYYVDLMLDEQLCDNWISDSFTKVILAVDNLEDFNKIIQRAENNYLIENKDYFIIRDNCLTELKPDKGETTCATCIGFIPKDKESMQPIVGDLPLFY